MARIPITPVSGYRELDAEDVEAVNLNKILEERVLRVIDHLAGVPDYDARWLAIALTHIQQGFMAMNRAVMRPRRIDLDGNDGDQYR